MMKPCVSVIIPAYNAAGTLERAIQSAVDQAGVLEVIVVDDCSSDHTVSLVQGLSDKYESLVLVEQHQNSGASVARNAGIAAASGQYIAFLDADDVWLPGKLEKQLPMICSDDGVVLVTCDSLQLSSAGQVLKRAHLSRPPASGINAWKTLLAYNFIPTPTVLVRRKDILTVGGFLPNLPVAEDLDLWIRISLTGKIAVVPETFVHYFDYPASLMKSEGDKTEEIVMSMIQNHITQNQSRLSRDEIQHILAVRNFDFGLQKFFSGDGRGSIPYFVHSLKNKYRILKSLQYILRAVFRLEPKAVA